ncbi:homing endonuclease associated repeat-containing protein [Halorussus salinisoli]|uniref:homing endonuclease associated repeat-containing protein n=1 Tax=Halorussus salinisoli TaxID=2558242 RepID=UPI0010C2341A|nr:hypothetical protein [Halorussus salinisoli]
MSDAASSEPDKHALRVHLQTLAVDLGKPPTVVDMHEHGDYHPQTYVDSFGSWDGALQAAGLDPDDIGKKIPDLELLSELQRLAEEFGRPPKKSEMADHSKYSGTTYKERFGSWNNALQEAMLDTRTYSDRELLQELRQLATDLDQTPRQKDMAEHGKYAPVTYYRRFNSWTAALEEADLNPRENQQHGSNPSLSENRTHHDRTNEPTTSDGEHSTGAMNEVVTPEAFARTYNNQSYDDPWTAVEQYHRVKAYTADHPNKGSTAVANALDLPRSRIRPWMEDDARPDCLRGIQTAEEYGWLPLTVDASVFPAFNTLVAWIFSSGSIDEDRVVPSFVVDNEAAKARVTKTLADLGLDARTVREGDHSRATELVPASDASILGRILTALGAPHGKKIRDLELPSYLGAAPPSVRDEFVDVYLLNRGQTRDETDTITVHEERSSEYLEELAALFRQISGGTISVSGQNVIISAEAARNLYGKFGPPWA